MRTNISKLRNINEVNLKLEKRFINEQLKTNVGNPAQSTTTAQPQQTKTPQPQNPKNLINVDISPLTNTTQETLKGINLSDQEKNILHTELKKDKDVSNFLSLDTNSDWLNTLKDHAKIKGSAKSLSIEIPKLGKKHNVSLNLGAKLTKNVWDQSAKLGSVNVGAKINF